MLPPGYASIGPLGQRPQPPARQPLPLPPQQFSQGTVLPRVIGAPQSKANAPAQAPLFLRPILQVFHSVFGG